jgi:hypothetical protein
MHLTENVGVTPDHGELAGVPYKDQPNANPSPSYHTDITAWLPPVDELLKATEERALRDHAHMVSVYWEALMTEKVPFHLAETLIEEFSADSLSAIEADDEPD